MGVRYQFKDTLLLDASDSGERLIAIIRLIIYLLVGLVPLSLYFISNDSRSEVVISVILSGIAAFIAVIIYWVVTLKHNRSFVTWIISALDISLITLVLLLIALYGNPITATNSLVIWQLYSLIIFSTTLRLNVQVTIFTGALSVVQYTLLMVYFDYHWQLSDHIIRSEEYGLFNWTIQLSRITILMLMTLIAAFFVSRSRKLVIFSGTDSLTGLKNRAYFEHVFSTEIATAVKSLNPLSIAFLDFDHFKKINDEYGHGNGDIALQQVSDVLAKHVVKPYKLARWGGEEFAILLPGETKEEATHLVNQIRKELKQGVVINSRLNLKLNLSAGIAECPLEGSDALKLINLADDRMLQAKNTGRDKVISGLDI